MKPGAPSLQSTRLLDQVRERIRSMHCSLKSKSINFIEFVFLILWSAIQSSGLRHPREMGAANLKMLLSMLANERKVSASTRNQALSALLCLHREAPGMALP